MEAIQDQAIQTYQKNLEYLAKNHKELSKLLHIFERAIQNGDFVPQFDLEYINGYFDIKDLKSNKYLYESDSLEISKQFVNKINFRKNSYIFEGFPVYNFSPEGLKNLDTTSKTIEGVLPIMSYYSQNFSEFDTMKKIYKFMIIGVGIGLHIPLIHQKVSASEYLIVEDNLEIFKLSLFTTKYYELAEDAELYFAISDDENIFLQTMTNFLEGNFFFNRYIKYFKFPTHSNDKLKQIQNAITTQSFIFFPYKAELFKSLKPLEYLNDGYNLLNVGTHFNDALFYDKPVLLLAAGPSFQKNIEWIKNNHKKFIIIAVSATLNTLNKHNIKPDLITHLDGDDISAEHFRDACKTDFLDHALVLFGPNTPTIVRKMFKKEQIFYYDEGTDFVKNSGSIYAPCIGSSSLFMSLVFNTQNLYLLGLDLAVNQETGGTHADEEHVDFQKINLDKKHELQSTMEYIKNLFPIQGNFKDIVYTNSLLHTSVQSLYRNISSIKRADQKIYNLSEGAKISKAIPTSIKDVHTEHLPELDKEILSQSLHSLFLSHSLKNLHPQDIELIQKRLESAKNIRAIIDEYDNLSHTNTEKYLYDLLGLISSILHKKGPQNKNIVQTYLLFFKYSLAIIIDFMNAKELKNEKRHIKKLDKLLKSEMYDIADIYISKIEEFLKTRG
ncbi:DUF115 domain-containing protein [bacterium]|nr:DUF115 domain-containing protein [bacterium]MBU1994503.1 DUF115 domain-containing protein [bacterium]